MTPGASRRSGVCGGPRACVARYANSDKVARHGHDDRQPERQRYRCTTQARFDDLTDTIFAGHHQPLRIWILCPYFMGLNLSNHQVVPELDLNVGDVQVMTARLRASIMAARPVEMLKGVVEYLAGEAALLSCSLRVRAQRQVSGQSFTRSPVGRSAAHHSETRLEPSCLQSGGQKEGCMKEEVSQPPPEVHDLLRRLQMVEQECEQMRVLLENAQEQVQHHARMCDELEHQLHRSRTENLRLASTVGQRDAELASLRPNQRKHRHDAADPHPALGATVEELHTALEELQATSDELAQSNLLLFQANEQLERRVAERTAELEHSSQALRRGLEERELLLREVHHRVRNNMQTIVALLRLQARRLAPETRGSFGDVLTRIQSMALAHELLHDAADLSRIDFGRCLEDLAARLFRAHQAQPDRVQFDVFATPRVLDLDTATSLALIVSEAVSNALRHAFPEGRIGRIRIAYEEADAASRLIIRDDGIGLPADLEACTGKGLGFTLMRALARQIGADLRIDTAKGTTVMVLMPDRETALAG